MAKSKTFEQEYQKEKLRRTAIRKAARKLKAKSKPRRGCCESCGSSDASLCANPYYKDMYGEIHMQYLCGDCYGSYCGDI